MDNAAQATRSVIHTGIAAVCWSCSHSQRLATGAHAAPNEYGLAVQRMPRIVDRDLLGVVGRM
jgi:hypothetical protein